MEQVILEIICDNESVKIGEVVVDRGSALSTRVFKRGYKCTDEGRRIQVSSIKTSGEFVLCPGCQGTLTFKGATQEFTAQLDLVKIE